jgi:hypothetical protein
MGVLPWPKIQLLGDKVRCAKWVPYAKGLLQGLHMLNGWPNPRVPMQQKKVVDEGEVLVHAASGPQGDIIRITLLPKACPFYFSGLQEWIFGDYFRLYPAAPIPKLGVASRHWIEPFERLPDGFGPKDQLDDAEQKLVDTGASEVPIAPHMFSGNLRKVAQKLAGDGRLASSGLSPLFTLTHGLLSVDDPTNKKWAGTTYGKKHWIIEVGPDGVFAQKVTFCQEYAQRGLSPSSFESLSKKEQDKLNFLINKGWAYFDRAIEVPCSGLSLVYNDDMQAMHPAYGWAFSESGVEAQVTCWKWDAALEYQEIYRFKMSITATAEDGPTSASVSEVEHGKYWYGGIGGLRKWDCDYSGHTNFGGHLNFYGVPIAAPADPMHTPVAVYYTGETEHVYYYEYDATSTTFEETIAATPTGYWGWAERFYWHGPAPNPIFALDDFYQRQLYKRGERSTQCFSSDLTMGIEYNETHDIYRETWGAGPYMNPSGPNCNFQPCPWLSDEDLCDLAKGVIPDLWGEKTATNAQHWYIFMTWRESFNSQLSIVDMLSFSWDREAMHHYRQHRQYFPSVLYLYWHTHTGAYSTWRTAVTHEGETSCQFVDTDQNYLSGIDTDYRIFWPMHDGGTDMWSEYKTGYFENRVRFILGVDQANTIYDVMREDPNDPMPENNMTTDHDCVGPLLLAAMVDAFDKDRFLCSKNDQLDVCGQNVDYGFEGKLEIKAEETGTLVTAGPAIYAGQVPFNIFIAQWWGDPTEH